MTRKGYPSDVADEEWALVAPYLTLMTEVAPQWEYPLRNVFNGLRWLVRTGAQCRWLPHGLPPWYVVYQQYRRWTKPAFLRRLSSICAPFCASQTCVKKAHRAQSLSVKPCNQHPKVVVAQDETARSAERAIKYISRLMRLDIYSPCLSPPRMNRNKRMSENLRNESRPRLVKPSKSPSSIKAILARTP